MTDHSNGLDPSDVHDRLPHGWRVKDDGPRLVYGFADGNEAVDLPNLPEMPASFAIWRQSGGELWEAVWKEPHELGDDVEELGERICGTRERCVEWIAEKARNAEGCAGE